MATTSGELAIYLLESLEKMGVRYALLHHEADVARGYVTSDLDVLVDRPKAMVLREISQCLRKENLSVITQFPYDVNATSYFVSDKKAIGAVQLDMMYDPYGRGRLGIRSGLLLEDSVRGKRFNRINDLDGWLYLLVKRNMKQDRPRVTELVGHVRAFGVPEALARAARIMTPASSRCVAMLLDGADAGTPSSKSKKHDAQAVARVVRRAVKPVGFWTDIAGQNGEEFGEDVVGRFARILPRTMFTQRPEGRMSERIWWASKVVPMRWRPSLILSTGASRSGLRPDLELRSGEVTLEQACQAIVAAMAERTGSRI